MSPTVFAIVLLAALLHSIWNAVLKGGEDKLVGMTAVMMGSTIPAAVALLFVPFPASESFPFMVASIVIHFGYQVLLLNAYKIGDLTLVYPIARGTAPLVVTIISVWILGENLSTLQIASIFLICLGLFSLAIERNGQGLSNTKAASMAAATGVFIAGYSLVDGMGARAAGTAVGFMSVTMIANGLVFSLYVAWTRPSVLRKVLAEGRASFYVGSLASFSAYIMVVWAFTQAPIAMVTALRETSIVFALLLGVVFLRERLNLSKLVATMFAIGGAVLLKVGK